MLCVRFRLLDEVDWQREADLLGCVYFIGDVEHARIKIGFSYAPERRLKQLQTGSSGRLEIAGLVAGGIEVERIIQRDLAAFALHGEWFAAAGALQWLAVETKQNPLKRCLAYLVDRPPVQVWWEWDETTMSHVKHVWDSAKNEWRVVAHSGQANARSGWHATTMEIPDEE